MSLSPEDKDLLIEKVNIVLNCAGSVDFDAPLSSSINTNSQGALRMLDLCKQIKNLENYVHVSTCYVNSDKR